MRVKAIPAEAVGFLVDNPMVIAGAVVLAAGGYYVYTHQSVAPDADVAASTAQPSYGSYGFAPLSTGGIISSPSVGMGGSGIVDSVSNGVALQNVQDAKDKAILDQAQSNFDKDISLKQQMFDFEIKKNDQGNALSWAQLNANMAIAALNADIAYQGIQASNYQTSTALATSFLMSGKTLAMGTVVAPDGSQTSFGFTAANPDGSKKGRETNNYLKILQQSGFGQFMQNLAATQPTAAPAPSPSPPSLGVAPSATFGTIGAAAATPYASSIATPTVQPGGSSTAATVDGSSRYNRLSAYKREQIFGNTYDLA